jgi:murein DD-endopeptidase MepM/ murein hydrolase activator NlpD
MRISGSRGQFGRMAAKLLFTVAAASMLGACSNSIERFSAAYNNPSDADPVYTASVPQPKKPVYKKPVYQAPAPIEEETIIESPVAKAPLPVKQPAYDYEQSYKKTYKQPQLAAAKQRVKLNQLPPPEEQVAEVETQIEEPVIEPVTKKPPFQNATSSKAKSGTVRVGEGMTLYSIAKANGLSADQLAEANNIREPFTVVPGQILRIPGKATAEMPEPTLKPKKVKLDVASDDTMDEPVVSKPKAKSGAVHIVSRGETLYSLGRTYGISPFAIADANGLSKDDTLRLGQKVKIPGASQALATNDEAPAEVEDAPVVTAKPKKKAPLSLAEEGEQEGAIGEDDQVAEVPVKKPEAKAKDQEQIASAPAPSSNGLSLRWPVKGKVISGFGPKANGLKNEGINIAVPEGTSIRAADNGVVAYAGSELKGYGNLVLIRHADGYVTAYAHAKQLLVKRGDAVKRGDVIAKAGQTGAVSSPQLHFEVRKGATALDPIKHLSSATASN